MPPRGKRAPAWSNGELMDLISVWGEESVQAQLRSGRRNYDIFEQISRSMLDRGHDRDALQCRVKVKELRSAYYKAREGNRRSGAAPTTCRFYREMDEILGGDPTANPRITMDTSEQAGGQEEEAEEAAEAEETASEAPGMGEETADSLEACSQELFSSQEESTQSQQPAVAEGQAEERVTVTLTTGLPRCSTSQRLQNLRKNPRKSKEDMLKTVLNQSARESKDLKDWREKESRTRKRNAVAKRKTTERLLSILERQAESIESLVAMQAEHYRATPPPAPSFVPCAPMSAQTTFPQHPGSYHHQLPPTPVCSPTSPDTYHHPYPLHSTPITMQYMNPEVQDSLNSNPDRAYANL